MSKYLIENLFGIEGWSIAWYGVIIAVGMVLGVILAIYRARKQGLKDDLIFDFILLALPIAIVCARGYYVVFEWNSYSGDILRFLYKGIIIKHNKTEPTYTKTSLFLCEKRRFLWPGLRKEGNLFKLAGPGGLAFFHLTKKEVSKWPMKK